MFSQKKLKIAFSIMLIIVGIFAMIQIPMLALPVLGGVITQGILGGFSGKVGPVVGGKWKDIDYMRGYVIPANPNTTGQQTVRLKFAKLVAYAQSVLATLLQVYWDPFYSNMSGFNAFISNNYADLPVNNIMDDSATMAKGTLEPLASITSAIVAGTSLTVTFNGTVSGNGLATDELKAVVIRFSDNTLHFIDSSDTRADSPVVFTVPPGLTDDDYVWVFCHRGTGSSFLVSNDKVATIGT